MFWIQSIRWLKAYPKDSVSAKPPRLHNRSLFAAASIATGHSLIAPTENNCQCYREPLKTLPQWIQNSTSISSCSSHQFRSPSLPCIPFQPSSHDGYTLAAHYLPSKSHFNLEADKDHHLHKAQLVEALLSGMSKMEKEGLFDSSQRSQLEHCM